MMDYFGEFSRMERPPLDFLPANILEIRPTMPRHLLPETGLL